MPPTRRIVISGAVAAAVMVLCFLHYRPILCMIVFSLAYVCHDVLLGNLAAWAIGRTPKAFRWTFGGIAVRPNFSFARDVWSELVVTNWTWHDPPGFEDVPGHLLQIDRLTLRLELFSIYRAIRCRRAVNVDLLILEGLHFRTRRNAEGALNLWTALDLPDEDVNIRSIANAARSHGAMRNLVVSDDEGAATSAAERNRHDAALKAKRGRTQSLEPLPPIATPATRKAAGYWRREWSGDRGSFYNKARTGTNVVGSCLRCVTPRSTPRGARADRGGALLSDSDGSASGADTSGSEVRETAHDPLLPPGYKELPIGDPNRRPRWGVPIRFDIRQAVLHGVQLQILDLLMLGATTFAAGSLETSIHVGSLEISRERFEKGDERRSGSDDGIHGVYLGEMVWVLIAEAVPALLRRSPSRAVKNALLAAALAAKDATIHLGAMALELPLSARNAAKKEMKHLLHGPSFHGAKNECRLHVHLIAGRRITKRGKRVNVYAEVQLRLGEPGSVIDRGASQLQMLTRSPSWKTHFTLGPVPSAHSKLRVACFHQSSKFFSSGSRTKLLGEVAIPLSALLVESASFSSDGDRVGWFALVQVSDSDASPVSPVHCGEVKLGLRVENAGHLPDIHDVDQLARHDCPAWQAVRAGAQISDGSCSSLDSEDNGP